jgi:archaellin
MKILVAIWIIAMIFVVAVAAIVIIVRKFDFQKCRFTASDTDSNTSNRPDDAPTPKNVYND